MKTFSVISNLAYLIPIFFVTKTIIGTILALSLITLTIGSGWYHYQHATKGSFGHRYDETAMLMVLFCLTGYAGSVVNWPIEVTLYLGILFYPPLAAGIEWLPARIYTAIGALPSFLAGFLHASWLITLPLAVFLISVFIRGKDDNHNRHGWWHIGASLTIVIFLEVLK